MHQKCRLAGFSNQRPVMRKEGSMRFYQHLWEWFNHANEGRPMFPGQWEHSSIHCELAIINLYDTNMNPVPHQACDNPSHYCLYVWKNQKDSTKYGLRNVNMVKMYLTYRIFNEMHSRICPRSRDSKGPHPVCKRSVKQHKAFTICGILRKIWKKNRQKIKFPNFQNSGSQ